MELINIHDAKTHFSKLIASTMEGQEIIIGKAGKPVAKLSPYTPVVPKRKLGGTWEGEVWIADDFDDLPNNFMEHFTGDTSKT